MPNTKADPGGDSVSSLTESALTDAELDALPEYIFDDRRSILTLQCIEDSIDSLDR